MDIAEGTVVEGIVAADTVEDTAVAMAVGNKVRVVVEAADSNFAEATDLHILLTKNCCRALDRQKWLQ